MRTEAHRRLRRWMDETGTSQAALAEQVGRSEPAVCLWFTKWSRPDGDTRERLHVVAGIPPPLWSQKPIRNGKGRAA